MPQQVTLNLDLARLTISRLAEPVATVAHRVPIVLVVTATLL